MADTIIPGCKYEELTLEYDEFSLKQVMTNIDTQNIKTCNVQKCVLVNRLDNLNEMMVKRDSNKNHIHLKIVNPSENSFLKFSGKKYSILDCSIYKSSSHYYDGVPYDSLELVITLRDDVNNILLVCIPFKKSKSSGMTVASREFTSLFNEVHSQFSDESVDEFTAMQNIDFSNVLPDSGYFTYNSGVTDVIVYKPENGIELKETLIYVIENMFVCSEHKIFLKDSQNTKALPIYYSNTPATKSEADGDDIYIDCRPVDTQEPDKEYETVLTKVMNSLPKEQLDETISKLIDYVVKFIFAVAVLCLIIFLPSFFRSSDAENNNNIGNGNGSNGNGVP